MREVRCAAGGEGGVAVGYVTDMHARGERGSLHAHRSPADVCRFVNE